jgi:hypothetical protein
VIIDYRRGVVVPNHSRLLYYYAPAAELPAIVAAGRVPADAPAPLRWPFRLLRRNRGLVWLSDLAELAPAQAAGQSTVRPGVRGSADSLARVTVSVPDAQYWPRWAERYGVSARRQAEIDREAGGLSGRWWVVSRAIPESEWLSVAGRLKSGSDEGLGSGLR